MLKLFVVLVAVALVVMAAIGTANYIKARAMSAASSANIPGASSPTQDFEVEA